MLLRQKRLKVTRQKTFKIAAIVSYLLIFLMGDMIGFPIFCWLILITAVDFGSTDQIFAMFAIAGIIISFRTLNSIRTLKIVLLDVFCFVLLASPLIRRMAVVPLEKFNYWAFTIPTTLFIVLYLLSIYFSVRQYNRHKAIRLTEQNCLQHGVLCKWGGRNNNEHL